MREWEKNIRKVEPYVPGEQPKDKDIIKLNTNENPYPPAPHVKEVLESIRTEDFRKYPDPAADMLISAISENYGVDKEMIFTGVGSDDVLSMIFLTFFNSDKPVLFPDITYSFYDVWAEVYRIPYETIPLDEQFQIRVEDYNRENGGIVIANPNAPTGLFMPVEQIENIVKNNPDSIVIVDEAYVDFGAASAMPLIEKYDNLLVVQTFSKSRGMAGMRIGYAMGNPVLIKYLNDVKYSFNSYTMDQTTLALGAAAISDRAYFEETVHKVVETREWTKKELAKLGFVFGDSKANFIFASHPEIPAAELFAALREANIIVRYFNKPRIDNYLRITIGTQEDMEMLIKFLKNYKK